MDTNSRILYGMLVEALRLVAAEASVQVSSLPPFLVHADEVALTYNHAYEMARDYLAPDGVISQELLTALERLDGMFEAMSEDVALWTVDQLKQAPQWASTRILAKEILGVMGQELCAPDLSGTTCIQVRDDKA